MAHNLGQTRLAGFHRLREAVKEQDWEQAAAEMLDSRWAKQVGQRAVRLAEQMRKG
jgi:lysozyme